MCFILRIHYWNATGKHGNTEQVIELRLNGERAITGLYRKCITPFKTLWTVVQGIRLKKKNEICNGMILNFENSPVGLYFPEICSLRKERSVFLSCVEWYWDPHSARRNHKEPLILDFPLRSRKHNKQNGMRCINLWKMKGIRIGPVLAVVRPQALVRASWSVCAPQ